MMMYRPILRENTSMMSNYSTPPSTKNDYFRCETSSDGENLLLYVIITMYASVFMVIIMAITWLKKYQALKRRIINLQNTQQHATSPLSAEIDPVERSSGPEQITSVQTEENAVSASEFNLQSMKTASSSFNKADLTLHQLIKSGREGVLYKAKMARGAIKGHTMFTCKIYKKATKLKQVKREVMIMQNLNAHMNLLQLVDWDITEVPYMLIMEDVEHGSLRSFLKANKESLVKDQELKHLFTIALYHIAQAMTHLHSKMILHCNLALRNILVHRFPHEVKVAEFGMARDITKGMSFYGNCKKTDSKGVPFRWYPPEYFKHDFYGFKGDIWAFGILIWEMQTFGTIPYPDLKTLEEVVSCVCAGRRAREPAECRPEIHSRNFLDLESILETLTMRQEYMLGGIQIHHRTSCANMFTPRGILRLDMMRDCWQDPYFKRPSFMDIVRILENILENDRDYVNMDSSPFIVSATSEDEE